MSIARQGGEAPPAVATAAFSLPRPEQGAEYGDAILANGDRAVVQLTAVVDGDPEAVDEATREALSAQFRQRYGTAQWQSSVDALRARSSIETYPENL